MRKKILLACLLVCVGWAGAAHGQTAIGTPTAPEPAVAPAPRFPLLANLMRNLRNPDRANTGPLLPPQPIVEATPTREDIARMVADGGYSPAEIAAAKIKMDEAQAKFRQAAVRYLGTIDCHYYPEAELGLIGALRADRSEAVRLEAAMALGTCRGATSKMLEALNVSALGLETDGNPSESSERVRLAARNSLNHALSNGMGIYSYAPPMMYMMPITPIGAWTMPEYAVQPVVSYVPVYQPALPPVSPEERKLAETVGLPAKSVPAPPAPARSLFDWIQRHHWFSESGANGAATPINDPRLRGLGSLGSETTLAIPAAPSNPAYAHPQPYNNE